MSMSSEISISNSNSFKFKFIFSFQILSGAKTFQEDVTITGNAVVQNSVTIDTVDVSEEVVTLAGTHALGGKYNFKQWTIGPIFLMYTCIFRILYY